MAGNFQQEPDPPIVLGGQQVPRNLGTLVKWGAVILGLILLFALLSFLRSVYTDLLWYDGLGFKSVFVKILTTRIAMFVIGAVVFGLLLSASLYFAHRLSRGPVTLPLPPEAVDLLRKLVVWGSGATVVTLSLIFGSVFASRWETFLRFSNAVPFGALDPVYDKDISFYVFTLPMYSFLQGWLLGAAIIILLATLALYFVNFKLRGVGVIITDGLKIQVSVIAAVMLLILAWGHWLDRWELVLSGQGAVFGAAYADLNARKPALLILTIVAGGSGVLLLVNAYIRGVRLLVGALALWMVMAIALAGVWPALMQQFTVNPNEFVKEAPYIARNIQFTLNAFGLHEVVNQGYPVDETPTLTAELIDQNLQTVDNIRLWDRRPLSSVYRFEQVIRPYYDFKEADVDRYTVDGEYRQVMLAAREVAPEKLELQSQTWVNMKLRYTHGFGVAMSPVTEFTQEGRPEFLAKDIPSDGVIPIGSLSPLAQPDILVSNPRIYYGENTTDYVIVNTNTAELDFQAEDEGSPRDIRYEDLGGTGGVKLSSFLRRLAYAWQFADVNILISGEITGDSLIQYRREIQERIATVAPFLLLDEDPYIVAAEAGLFWVQDAYTVTDQYPYSDPFGDVETGSFNYMRNSVKVTVDAFHGTLRFHIWDPDDPIIRAYARIFPDLFHPKDAMPPSLQQHVRYPQDFFTIQADKYLRYHMDKPQDFYNLEDLWSIPREKFGQSGELQSVQPYYVIMKIPGEDREEFVLLLPYTRNEPNPIMAGWLAARSDGASYGELRALIFPKDRRVKGPEQIEADIDTDEAISEWFTLRCDETLGSFCIRGNLLVVPVAAGDTFGLLYAEPIYLQAESVEFPALKKVILATGERVVMEDTLDQALAALIEAPAVAGAQPLEGPAPSDGPPAPGAPPTLLGTEIEGVKSAIEGLKENLSQLEKALERLKELAGGE